MPWRNGAASETLESVFAVAFPVWLVQLVIAFRPFLERATTGGVLLAEPILNKWIVGIKREQFFELGNRWHVGMIQRSGSEVQAS